MLPDWGIGHNKFIVLLDKDGKPVAVLTGSTNFTPTGFCTQSNNMLVIDSAELAQLFVDYWHLVKADTDSGAILRTANAIRKTPVGRLPYGLAPCNITETDSEKR